MSENLIKTILLYGSSARGDGHVGSDVDLLGIVDKAKIHKSVLGSTNLTIYENSLLIKWAQEGNLFVFHLVNEAKILYDPNLIFYNIKSNFVVRRDYERELTLASMILSHLVENWETIKNWTNKNSVLIWCLRTTFAVVGINRKKPIFSSTAIAAAANNKSIKALIESRYKREFSGRDVKIIENIISEYNHRYGFSTREDIHVLDMPFYIKTIRSLDSEITSKSRY